jgi:hypothetical protein
MPVQIPREGLQTTLELMVGKQATSEILVCRLFTNNVAPGPDLIATDFSECAFAGYTSIDLLGAEWNFVAGSPDAIVHPEVIFTSSAEQVTPESVYGYFLTQRVSWKLITWLKFADGPYPIAHFNDRIKFPPTIKGRQFA